MGLGRGLSLDQEHAGDLQVPVAKLADRERGVVDGSESGPGDEQDREAQVFGQIGAGQARGIRDEEATGGFDEEAIAHARELGRAMEDGLDRDGHTFEISGGLGCRRQAEGIETDTGGRDRSARGSVEAEGVEWFGVDACLGGFEGDETPPAPVCGAEEGAADDCLSHAGVGARDEQPGERSAGKMGALIEEERRGPP